MGLASTSSSAMTTGSYNNHHLVGYHEHNNTNNNNTNPNNSSPSNNSNRHNHSNSQYNINNPTNNLAGSSGSSNNNNHIDSSASHQPTRSHNNWRKSRAQYSSAARHHSSTSSATLASTSNQSATSASSSASSSTTKKETQPTSSNSSSGLTPQALLDLSAKIVAEHLPFQSIEQRYEHIPEPVQRRIIFWSFPRHEDDIKMYSSLSSDTFNANAPPPSASSSNNNASNNSNNNATQSPSFNFSSWVEHHNNNTSAPVAFNNNAASSSTATTNSSALSKANSNNQKQLTFHKGLRLYNDGCVQDVLQVGFNLSGLVVTKTGSNIQANGNSKLRANHHGNSSNNNNNSNDYHRINNHNHALNAQSVDGNNNLNHLASSSNMESISSAADTLSTKSYRVSVTFDRCKITSVSCTCELQDIFWCEHVVALILHRIRNTETIDLRVPISETLSSLDRKQLQKLVQYLIAEHYTEVLPTAQRLLDEMRQSYSDINRINGAPDPTAGARADDDHIWHLDEQQVNEKVQNYLNMVCNNSKDAVKQINALFEKIREMFRAGDSNGTRLLKLITEQFLMYATRNEKSRFLWDQLISLWVVVMLNPDISDTDRKHFVKLLLDWSKTPKCPKEDLERRVVLKRKAVEVSDDEDSDEYTANNFCSDYLNSFSQSNNIPAHLATHRHRSFQPNNDFPALRSFNQLPSILPPSCPCQIPHQFKKLKSHHHHPMQSNGEISGSHYRPSTSSSRLLGSSRSHGLPTQNSNDNRPAASQEPRSVFHRALDFKDISWNDPHLQLILNKDGPVKYDSSKSHLVDHAGNLIWNESLSQAAARIETLRSHGYREQALRLTLATVRRLKNHQNQWFSSDSQELWSHPRNADLYSEGWIGHPMDPINVMVDLLLESSSTEVSSNSTVGGTSTTTNPCGVSSNNCSCPYNQALADFTHRLIPGLASLSYQHGRFPMLPLVNLAPRRPTSSNTTVSNNKTPYYHVPVPGCCQNDSYLTLAVETALIALGQQKCIPTIATAHDRAVRQEADLISKLESIDTTDPLLLSILKHQANLILEGGPFQNSCCGVPTDSAPLHTFAKYLFDSLVAHCPQLAYKIGVYALKMPLMTDEIGENFGAARTSPRSINHNHLQSEQLELAQAMLSKAKDEGQSSGYMRRVHRASVKNIRNPASLLKLSKHALKEAKPNGNNIYRSLLETAFELGLQVLKLTKEPHTSNGKTRREAIIFIVECATDLGLKSVLHVMKHSKDHFSAIEALGLVVSRDNEHANLRSQALTKLKLKDRPLDEAELNFRCRDLVLDCAGSDPTNCALDALKFCEVDSGSLNKALKIVIDAGANGIMDSTQLIKVADHIHARKMTDKAFEIALVAVESLSIPSNSDNTSSRKDIFRACEFAKEVNGFSTLIPKLIANIECATVLSEIYHEFGNYRRYDTDIIASYRDSLSYSRDGLNYNQYNDILLNSEIYKQKIEDARWWDALLKRTLKAFVDTTRTRLQNISPRHYGEFIEFLVKAQDTFGKAAYGPQQFKDLISEIMKSYRTKKKLMEKLKSRFDCSIKAGI